MVCGATRKAIETDFDPGIPYFYPDPASQQNIGLSGLDSNQSNCPKNIRFLAKVNKVNSELWHNYRGRSRKRLLLFTLNDDQEEVFMNENIENTQDYFSDLTDDQKTALKAMLDGKNVFVTGGAGTGKSFVLKRFVEIARSQARNVLVTAPTGIAALNAEGCTLHRAFRLGTGVLSPYNSINLKKVPDAVKYADTIIIDEISMCRLDLFDYVYRVLKRVAEDKEARWHRKALASGMKLNALSWGRNFDTQIIVVGDFYQLPPVLNEDDYKALSQVYDRRTFGRYDKGIDKGFAFQGLHWKDCQFEKVILRQIMRQKDISFANALNQARVGDFSCLRYLETKTSSEPLDDGIWLCAKNKAADKINREQLETISEDAKTYRAAVSGVVSWTDMPTDKVLTLKVGARVMILTNDKEDKYVNGSLGTIKRLPRLPGGDIDITLENGAVVSVSPYEWKITVPEAVKELDMKDLKERVKIIQKEIGQFRQYPLRLAYAVTMHKSQGQTFQHVNVQAEAFAAGQMYVALSRATTPGGMYIDGIIYPQSIKASPAVAAFYEEIEKEYEKEQNEQKQSERPIRRRQLARAI